jgi:hypothetical protein
MDAKITPLNLQKFKLFLERKMEDSSSDSPDSPDKTDLTKYGSLDKVGDLSTTPIPTRTPPLPKRPLFRDFVLKTPELKERKKAAEAPL